MSLKVFNSDEATNLLPAAGAFSHSSAFRTAPDHKVAGEPPSSCAALPPEGGAGISGFIQEDLLARVSITGRGVTFRNTKSHSWLARVGAGGLRTTTAILDGLQLVVAPLVSALLLPSAVGELQALLAGCLAVGIALAMQRGLRYGGGGGSNSPEALPQAAWRSTWATAAAICIVGASAALASQDPWQALAWACLWLALSTPATFALRHGAAWLAARNDAVALGVVIVGPPELTSQMARFVTADPASGWRLQAELNDVDEQDLCRLRNFANSPWTDVVILAMAGIDHARIRAVCEVIADSPVRVCLGLPIMDLQESASSATRRGSGLPVVDLVTNPHGGLRGRIKRCMDVAVSLVLLLFLLPLLLVVALAIRLETPGPVLFSQRRFGVRNEPIEILKFRTMRADLCDPSGAQRTAERDPRVTRLGRILRRTSIDELPQLLNVLRGDMSLIGPRPHALHMKVGDHFYFEAVDVYRIRHRVKPGITGWAQVNGSRGEIDTMEKALRRVELDFWYIQNWSLALDVRILLRTVLGGFASKAD